MKSQEIFDKVCNHLLKQNKMCQDQNNNCVYLATDGTKCTVGSLIPKKLYKKDIEGIYFYEGSLRSIDETKTIIMKSILKKIGVNSRHYKLLGQLQDIHDHLETAEWPNALLRIAKRYHFRRPNSLKKALKRVEES